MGYAVIAWDGEDEGALDRRMAARDRHMAVIAEWAADGRLADAVPQRLTHPHAGPIRRVDGARKDHRVVLRPAGPRRSEEVHH